ncbi:DivIVA domain-containing protein [Actinoalloteichus hymeniacidonis]|nr:DivIVA domain-containing protein [Actinoalloteichus hymeniacidonis]
MTTLLIYLAVMLLVAAVVFLLASVIFGNGEQLAPLPPGVTPTTLPKNGSTGDDVRALRFQQAVRGYRMTEVDWALDKIADELDGLRTRVSQLETQLEVSRQRSAEQTPAPGPQQHSAVSADAEGVSASRTSVAGSDVRSAAETTVPDQESTPSDRPGASEGHGETGGAS